MNLKRIAWAVRGVFALGIAASLAGNILHAQDNLISQAISAWSPLALLLTVELISRIPISRGWLAGARLAATAVIAGIAAWVSYGHMHAVAQAYGETGAAPYLLPLSVDGLIVVASISLVEIGRRLRAEDAPAPEYGVTQPDDPTIDWDAELKELAKNPLPVPPAESPEEHSDRMRRTNAALRGKPAPWDARKVVEMIQDGAKRQQIIDATGVTPAPLGHMIAAVRFLQANPGESLPATIRVSAGNAQLIRTMVPR